MFQGLVYSPLTFRTSFYMPLGYQNALAPPLPLQRWGVNCVLSQILGGKGKHLINEFKVGKTLHVANSEPFSWVLFFKWDDSLDVCICVYRGWSAHPTTPRLRDHTEFAPPLWHRGCKRQKTLAVAAWFVFFYLIPPKQGLVLTPKCWVITWLWRVELADTMLIVTAVGRGCGQHAVS